MARTKKTDAAVPAVPTESEITPDDPHYNIPQDSNGLPIYFILPPGVKATYERWMSPCERGWSATGDPAFVAQALVLTFLHRQPMPLWLAEAAVTLVLVRRTKTQVNRALERHVQWMRFDAMRTAKEDGLRWLEARIEHATKLIADFRSRHVRAERIEAAKQTLSAEDIEAVKQTLKDAERRAEKIRKRGWVTWEEARQLAVEALRGTGAKAKTGTMRKDYNRVKQDLDARRGALYFIPKVPRKTLTEILATPPPEDTGMSMAEYLDAYHH